MHVYYLALSLAFLTVLSLHVAHCEDKEKEEVDDEKLTYAKGSVCKYCDYCQVLSILLYSFCAIV